MLWLEINIKGIEKGSLCLLSFIQGKISCKHFVDSLNYFASESTSPFNISIINFPSPLWRLHLIQKVLITRHAYSMSLGAPAGLRGTRALILRQGNVQIGNTQRAPRINSTELRARDFLTRHVTTLFFWTRYILGLIKVAFSTCFRINSYEMVRSNMLRICWGQILQKGRFELYDSYFILVEVR